MLSRLDDVLNNRYASERQKLDFIKLISLRDCFNKEIFETMSKNTDEAQKKQKERAEIVLKNWPKDLESAPNKLTDEQALSLAQNLEFPNYEAAKNWLIAVTSARMLRDTFDREGRQADRDKKPEINLERWTLSSEKIKDIEKKSDSEKYYLLQLARSLGLIDEYEVPKCNHIIIQGALEPLVTKSINFLVDSIDFKNINEPIHVYYNTGPRFLFNHEESLADILASKKFLNVPDKVDIIRGVLKSSKENWLTNLPILQQKILDAVGLEKWPEKVDSYYYENAEKHQASVKESGVESIKCWPVAMDMVVYLFEKHAERNLALKQALASGKIVLHPVVAQGKPGKLATTADVADAFFKEHGKNIKGPVASVCGNESYDVLRHAETTANMSKKYGDFTVIPCGPAAETLTPAAIFDSVAKGTFEVLTNALPIKTIEPDKKKESSKTALIDPKSIERGVSQPAAQTLAKHFGLHKKPTAEIVPEETSVTSSTTPVGIQRPLK